MIYKSSIFLQLDLEIQPGYLKSQLIFSKPIFEILPSGPTIPPISLNYHFWVNPPSIIILYHSCCTVFWHVFNAFYCLFSTYLHKSSNLEWSLFMHPPPHISFNSHSRSQPPSPPLSLSDMIFERSLNLQISWCSLQPIQVDACQKEQKKKQNFTISLDMHQILKVAYML